MPEQTIPYNKGHDIKSRKIYGSGGPRDAQRMHSSIGTATINMPQIDNHDLKNIILSNKETREELKAEIKKELENVKEVVSNTLSFEGVGLPFEVVEQKIREAVNQTEQQVKERYESGLGSLNSQLNVAKIRIKELEHLLNENRQEFSLLKIQSDAKDKLISELRESQTKEVYDLKNELVELISKIKSGPINKEVYINSDRPSIEHKVFINPLDEINTDLESHIDISAAESKGNKIDLKNDVAKLKDLLGKGKYKPGNSVQ